MDRAISEEEKKLLLKNAKIKETMSLEQLMPEILIRDRSHGFAREAINDRKSENYKWAHTTARGIIWLWLQQKDEAIRAQWLREPKGQWRNFEPPPSPPPDSPIRFSESASASRASAAYAKAGPLSFEPVSVPSSPRSSPRKHKGAGYPKRRTNKMRKTRRKSSRRGRSRSRSRSHHIRRKKTHHRRHRR
jgi:hypothetical protein